MRLATILTAAVLSTGLACQIEPPTITPNYEPSHRDDRIEWRSNLGIQAAHQFVFQDCIPLENLEESLREYGIRHNLSARDVAESIAWGLYHHRFQLPPSEADTLRAYINEKIDIYGERFVAVTDILYNRGDYNGTIQWYLYEPIRSAIAADNPQQLRTKVVFALGLAQRFNGNLEIEYQEMRNYWNGNDSERR